MNHFRDIHVIKTFGNKVRDMRKSKGLTMEMMAAKLEMEYKQYSRIELGEVNTNISRAYSIAKVLEVNIGELFDDISS